MSYFKITCFFSWKKEFKNKWHLLFGTFLKSDFIFLIWWITWGHSNPQSSTSTWYIISQLRGKWVQRAIWTGRLWSSGGSNWHSNLSPYHHPPQHCQILPSSFLKLTELLAWGLGANPDLVGFCLCSTHMNMNIIICWHQDARQIKTRLSDLVLLFQARHLK